ncbi:hypothetical protein [Thiolapillus sp.]|uniref:hypothetical protein n=1 Tax=Thiolapillus sp. TaxID=2017437 RepID=UPI003AF4E906
MPVSSQTAHFTLLKNNGTTPTPPAAPDQLTATPGGPDRIDLSWHDNADNEDAFVLERSLDKQVWTETASLSANSTGYVDCLNMGGFKPPASAGSFQPPGLV